jgi:uncharacterized membrane protein
MLRLLASERAYIRAWQERAAHIEKQVLDKIRHRERVSKNVAVLHEQQLTFGERVSDRLATVAGSWSFIFAFGLTLGIWILVNTIAFMHHWDKYPYILLNLMLSMLAAIQAPVIMMSQHRQEDRDRLRAEHDYEVNLKAEIEIQQLHQKLDELVQRRWNDLLALQKQQIDLLQAQLALLRGQAENSRDG